MFLEAAKKKMRAEYDYILIDSRTGVSDTAGICTVQMPDILVVCFTLNNQSIEGASAVATSVYEQRGKDGLHIFPVPMRLENAEKNKLSFRTDFAKKKFRQFPDYLWQGKGEQYWGEVPVPYVPYYAYEEILSTFGDRDRQITSLLASAERLTAYLTDGEVTQFILPTDAERREILARYEGKPVEANPLKQLNHLAETVFARLSSVEQIIARRVFTRLIRVARPEEVGGNTRQRVRFSDIAVSGGPVVQKFCDAQLLLREIDPSSSSAETLQIADDDLLQGWERLQMWISEDREFLLWRQNLRVNLAEWERNRDESALLRGAALAEAQRWIERRSEDFILGERLYIQRSRPGLKGIMSLRVVVASPSDVKSERDELKGIIDDINQGIAKDRGVRLEVSRWEADTYAGFHADGPQGLIDAVLRISECDLFVGIFWKRFGSPMLDGMTGTEHEFQLAYETWKQTQRPQIMVYFNQKAAVPKTPEEADQWKQVLEFQRQFPKEGLWWSYKGKAQFEKLVRQHLTAWLQQQTSLRVARQDSLREAYLAWLMEQVRAVPLSGVDRQSIYEESRRDVDIAAVYTALMSQRPEATEEHLLRQEGEQRRLSALAVLDAEPRLALLGDSGSGKSTFVNFLALCMVGELLHRTEANLEVLRTPLTEDDESFDKGKRLQPQPWSHGVLLPLRVVLREFVARSLAFLDANQAVNSDTLLNFLITELPETVRDFAGPLRMELLTQGGLLLLDGLDEVPEADARRVQVKTAVEQFAATFPKVRILVTSRTYAYQQQDWKLRGFAEAVLAPFSPVQIRTFVERWYAFVGQVRKLTADDMRDRAVQLNTAIECNPRLLEMATRPLLLTLIASLHAWRGGTLPEQREELYADAVELLLDQWDRQKFKRLPDGTYEVAEPSLIEWLRVDHKKMRQLLNRLAFHAHCDQPSLMGTADIAEAPLVNGLLRLDLGLNVNPGQLITYLRDRAGILEPRGVGIYAFPHRTFQEYLAACHLTDQADFPDNIADLLRTEPNRWREVTLLAGAKAVRGAATNVWALVEALCFDEPPEKKTDDERGYWGALLAAQVLIENNSLQQIVERNRQKVERIRRWLTCILTHGALPPIDRVQAGDALAIIGDPRFRADAYYLPDEPLLGFIEIPAGPFVMGSDPAKDEESERREQPQHEVILPRYYIARYPVTVAQFAAFVTEANYEPADKDCLHGISNHPVVYVSWHDARKYCEWLTEQLHNGEGTPAAVRDRAQRERWEVTLPSEAEWEKAARGTDGRIYPWGNTWEDRHANPGVSRWRWTNAVGCFPEDRSPYGCEDMAGGVQELTRSMWGKDINKPDFLYPYNLSDGREQMDTPDNPFHVLRGNSHWGDQKSVRCASRGRHNWKGSSSAGGFRVVVLPKNSER